MENFTLQISEDELREVTEAYKVLQGFLARIISPNDLYNDEFYNSDFLGGLKQAQKEVIEKEFVEVTDLAGFTK